MIEVIGKFDIEKVLEEIKTISLDMEQVMLQGVKGQHSKVFGTGSITKYDLEEKDFKYSIFDTLYTNSLLEEYNMVRTRIMTMPSKTCYSYHWDLSSRIHLPLITNDDCFFVIEDNVYRTPADGSIYRVDTTKKHTFVNASFDTRIHIMGVENGTTD